MRCTLMGRGLVGGRRGVVPSENIVVEDWDDGIFPQVLERNILSLF
jgi:hypothetical protein